MRQRVQVVRKVFILSPMHVLVAQTYILSAKNVLMLQHAQAAIQAITPLQAAPHVLHARISPIVWSVAMEVHAHLAVVVIMLALARALLAVM